MFTGIIESIGTVKSKTSKGEMVDLRIGFDAEWSDLQLGESIAVNGTCLTVTSFDNVSFTADISLPTLNHTSLKDVSLGESVNLERALKLGDRLGGHIVQGHVDGTGAVTSVTKKSNNIFIEVSCVKELLAQMILKGSVSIDGISLTIQELKSGSFVVVVIPHTFSNTALKRLKSGSVVNLETDLISKYVAKHVSNNRSSSLTESFFHENGFN